LQHLYFASGRGLVLLGQLELLDGHLDEVNILPDGVGIARGKIISVGGAGVEFVVLTELILFDLVKPSFISGGIGEVWGGGRCVPFYIPILTKGDVLEGIVRRFMVGVMALVYVRRVDFNTRGPGRTVDFVQALCRLNSVVETFYKTRIFSPPER